MTHLPTEPYRHLPLRVRACVHDKNDVPLESEYTVLELMPGDPLPDMVLGQTDSTLREQALPGGKKRVFRLEMMVGGEWMPFTAMRQEPTSPPEMTPWQRLLAWLRSRLRR